MPLAPRLQPVRGSAPRRLAVERLNAARGGNARCAGGGRRGPVRCGVLDA